MQSASEVEARLEIDLVLPGHFKTWYFQATNKDGTTTHPVKLKKV